MKLLNYTSQIDAAKSIGEIFGLLSRGGATAILSEFDANGNTEALSFRLTTSFGPVSYRLPANVPAAILVLNRMVKASGREKIPSRYFNNADQARRIAWRIVKDWVEAQLAINQLGQAKLEQIMLPFAVTDDGRTVYERCLARGALLLTRDRSHEMEVVSKELQVKEES